jgi:succinate dehydrogenase hydrophobic anchor subunit
MSYKFHAVKIAYIYSGASILIGPVILAAGNKLFPARLACFDIEPNLPHEDVILQYHNQQLFESITAILMICVGIFLIYLLTERAKTKQFTVQARTAIIPVVMMIFGYTLIILFAAVVAKCVTN